MRAPHKHGTRQTSGRRCSGQNIPSLNLLAYIQSILYVRKLQLRITLNTSLIIENGENVIGMVFFWMSRKAGQN